MKAGKKEKPPSSVEVICRATPSSWEMATSARGEGTLEHVKLESVANAVANKAWNMEERGIPKVLTPEFTGRRPRKISEQLTIQRVSDVNKKPCFILQV
jgi:hypothetical protein